MQIKDLVKNPGQWLKGTGPNSDIIISSRIRLARNLEKMPFSHWAPEKIRKKVLETIESALKSVDYMKGCLFIHMNTLDGVDKQLLLERHLVSREQLEPDGAKAVAISDQEIISIMINEEDHLRIQVIQSGFDLVEAYRLIGEVDNKLEQKLIFAFNPSLGYLTACPTNVGTGMRASAMMHLPALVMNKQIDKILQAIPKLNLTARGFYGEGTTASGNFFQISNQVTLGQKEEDIIDNLARVVRQVMEHEAATRQVLLMIDGIPFNTQLSGQANPSLIPTEHIKQIEIIKGASSSAWGSSLGGVINVITKDVGDTPVPKGTLTSSFAEFATTKNSLDLAGKIKDLGYFVSGSYFNTDGAQAFSETEEKKYFGKLSLPFGDEIKLTGSLGYMEANPRYALPTSTFLISQPQYTRYGKILLDVDQTNYRWNVSYKFNDQDITTVSTFISTGALFSSKTMRMPKASERAFLFSGMYDFTGLPLFLVSIGVRFFTISSESCFSFP